ncbi:hypothetical protein KKF84_11900 [Myxococcota bacterium]|nr:hypothetical protein [Myxococcota bacterium]MBU1536017.1 hypothetical protein [Myxococcota bacterium]
MFCFKAFFAISLAFATYMCEPDKTGDEGTQCSSNNANNEPDGGLVCGESYDISDGQGGPGVFAAKVTQYVHINAAGIVETDTMSTLLMRVEYHADEDPMYARVQLCRLEIPAVNIPGQPNPTVMTLRESLFANLDPVDVALQKEGDTTCSALSFDPAVTLFGIRLNDDINDAVPYKPQILCPDGGAAVHQSPCLWDMDEDGSVGVTLDAANIPGIEVTEVYMAMRSWTSSQGIVATSDLILGEAQWGLEQYVLGCKLVPIGASDERICTEGEREVTENVNPVLGPVEGVANGFMAVRVDASMECTDIVTQAPDLFGR